jgi:hypothetical protein
VRDARLGQRLLNDARYRTSAIAVEDSTIGLGGMAFAAFWIATHLGD